MLQISMSTLKDLPFKKVELPINWTILQYLLTVEAISKLGLPEDTFKVFPPHPAF